MVTRRTCGPESLLVFTENITVQLWVAVDSSGQSILACAMPSRVSCMDAGASAAATSVVPTAVTDIGEALTTPPAAGAVMLTEAGTGDAAEAAGASIADRTARAVTPRVSRAARKTTSRSRERWAARRLPQRPETGVSDSCAPRPGMRRREPRPRTAGRPW